jgi:hypothetical protein
LKIRLGFVSNSSSSSFIVIGWGNIHIPTQYEGEIFVVDDNLGKVEYGWENEKSIFFGDRVCFAYIQAMYLDGFSDNPPEDTPHIDMLNKILMENIKCLGIDMRLTLSWRENGLTTAYIDHQSAAIEGENIEMFDSEEDLFNFLFSDNSYIQTGNDNEGY